MMKKEKPKLPSKESNIFKQMLKYYENKQFRKALKSADQILKKFPDHGETISMKGLTLNFLDKKEEAYELVKKGLRLDIGSHICWHVYGLLHRAHKNYEEASKCYLNALRLDKNNLQILRDLSILQIHCRNLDGFLQTRHDFLNSRPSQRVSWIGLALAYHLMNRQEVSFRVLETYLGTLPAPEIGDWDTEISEILLYMASLLQEIGRYQDVLDHLEKHKDQICDPQAVEEIRADIYLEMKNPEEAEKIIRKMINVNPEHFENYKLLEKTLGITDANEEKQKAQLIELYDKLAAEYPKAHVPVRLILNYVSGAEFEKHADKYMQFWLRKGAPSLFSNLKSLYSNEEKTKILGDLITKYITNLKKSNTFSGETVPEEKQEIPTTLLWTLFYAAQHFDRLRDIPKALEYIDECIEHTPTMVEVLQCKGRIYKHAGDINKAVEFVNKARELDLQDRFINAKCAKYMIRAEKITEAENVISLFTKGDNNDLANIFVDMQYLWYTVEAGDSFFRQGQFGKALKKYHQMEKHFEEITDDQFDFHSYCMQRKLTLRSYIRLLRLEDRLRSHHFYVDAARGAIKCYLHIFKHPEAAKNLLEPDYSDLSEEERKKAVSKQKKADAKAKAEEEARKPAQNSKKPVDTDPEGKLLLETKDPLLEATKFLKPLLQLLPNEPEVHELAGDVYLNRKKYTLALHALKKGLALTPDNPILHRQAVQFRQELKTLENVHPTVKKVLEEESLKLLGEESIQAYNEKFLAKHSKSTPHVLTSAEIILELDPNQKAHAIKLIEALPRESLEASIKIHESLKNTFKDDRAANSYLLKCREWFPCATYFAPPAAPSTDDSNKIVDGVKDLTVA